MDLSKLSLEFPFKTIVYATDFSPYSANAGHYAACLAAKFEAELVAAHSFVLSQPAMEAEASEKTHGKSVQRADLEAALTDAAGHFGKDLKQTRTVLLEGDPRETIPKLAAENDRSLIVLGTQGRGRVERGIVGSVAERILRVTNGPALTVGPAVASCDGECRPFRRILYATGLSPAAARGAVYAVAMAQAFNATLDVLHVIHPEEVEHPDRLSEIQSKFYAHVEEMLPQQTEAIRAPRAFVNVGTAHVQIQEHMREFEVDLLILSIRKSSHLWLESRLSGAFHIIANAPCPVMTITGQA